MGDKFDEIINNLKNNVQPSLQSSENKSTNEGLCSLNEGLITKNYTLNNEGLTFELSSKDNNK